MRHAAALLLLLHQARADCANNCAAPINVTCGSVLVVGDSTTDEYMPELRALLAKAGLAQAATTANGQFSSKPVAAAAAQSRSRSDRSAAGETSLASESEKDGKW